MHNGLLDRLLVVCSLVGAWCAQKEKIRLHSKHSTSSLGAAR